MYELEVLMEEIRSALQPERIILAVNILGRDCNEGSVYPDVPFKDKKKSFFYDVNNLIDFESIPDGDDVQLASHGLLHMDHSKCGKEAQELSIVTSCNFLETNLFIPPFNRYNYNTELACGSNNIRLMKPSEGWRSLDYFALVKNDFDISHDKWYLHAWRWNVSKFIKNITSKVNGFIPSHNGVYTGSVKTS